MKVPFFSLGLVAMLVACGGSDPVADGGDNGASLPPPKAINTSDPSGSAPPANSATPAEPATGTTINPAAAIPAAFHGRWGLVPGDCTSTRGDAKGLLTIAADKLSFYESRAVPAGNVNTSVNSFSADFAFTGEGMTWKKFETLQLKDGKLVRTESSPMASYTYARCS